MVDDVKDITEKAESKEALDRARLARERREAEQRKRLDELRAHAAAAQAQREKRDEDRRRRMAEARTKDEDRRTQVEERKRAIWEASISRREALLQRERDRTERLERARAARSSPRPAFAFGSSTPRLLEPVDSAGFFWAARRAASTTNVMFASAPLTRRASALHLDTSDTDNKDEPVSPQPLWSSVARRRTDLVPTLPARPGRAYSMTRLDRINAPTHHSRSQTRSGDTTPSRPGSAMSNTAGVVRRASSAPRKPRPASIAGTGVNTPRGSDTGANSAATTPSVSRDATVVSRPSAARRPRPLSLHAPARSVPAAPVAPGEGKPPLHRKPKPSKEHDKNRKSMSVSPGRALSPSRSPAKEHVEREMSKSMVVDKSVVSAVEVTQKLEALRMDAQQPSENKRVEIKQVTNIEQNVEQKEKIDVQKPVKAIEEREERKDKKEEREEKKEKRDERKEPSQEKTEDVDMTASMISRRITTEEEAKAALAERRRRAREELERQAEAERRRLQIEAEEEEERNRQEEERQRREEEEARELAALQRSMDEEKLRKAIEVQQQLERDEALRRVREEEERLARRSEEEERRRAAESAEVARRGEAEREERERLARKQRVEAIMARTRLKKQAEEDKKQQEMKAQQNQPANGESTTTNTQDSVPDSNTTQENIVNMNVTQGSSVNTSVTQESLVNTNATQESLVNINATQESLVNTNATQESLVNTNATQESLVNTNATQESLVNTNATQESLVNTNVTQENVVNTSITQHSVPSANSTKEIVANITESVTIPNESATSAIIPNTNASEKSTVENSTESVNLVNVESEVKVENAQTAESVGKVANIDNSNGNVEAGELLDRAAARVDSQSAPPTNNGNVADLLGLSTQLETVDKPEEHTPTKQIDNTPILDTNNGNANVGHISANFIQTERMAEVTNKLADDFATHNGHGHNHPLTLQNAI